MGYSESDWYGLGAYVSPIRVDETSTRSEHIEAMIDRAYDYLGTSYIIGASGAPGTGVELQRHGDAGAVCGRIGYFANQSGQTFLSGI